jgi:hypothetical protein
VAAATWQDDDWRNSPTIVDWSEEVLKEIPDSPEVVPGSSKVWGFDVAEVLHGTLPQPK